MLHYVDDTLFGVLLFDVVLFKCSFDNALVAVWLVPVTLVAVSRFNVAVF